MRIDDIIWRAEVIDKLGSKRGVEPYEVDEVSTMNLTFDLSSVATVPAKMCTSPWDKQRRTDT